MLKTSFLICIISALICVTLTAEGEYSYDEQNLWPLLDETCGSQIRQSPIDIDTFETRKSIFNSRIYFFNYKKNLASPVTIENTGQTINVFPGRSTSHIYEPFIMSTALPGKKFKFHSLHFHWGSTNDRGSEHKINGQQYSLEMHLIHRNLKYNNISEALNHGDGLVVLGVLYKASDFFENYNFGLGRVTWLLNNLVEPSSEVKIDNIDFSLNDLLGNLLFKSNSYYTYDGSLTTPPCSEAVTWVVFKDVQKVSEFQLNLFRQIRDVFNEPMSDNYRLTQRVGKRKVYYYKD